MKIHIASDHAGFNLKEFLKKGLGGNGIEIVDMGPDSLDQQDDYPQTTEKLIKLISQNPAEKGILICKNGVGVTIFANRFKNVRAGLSWSPKHAKSHRLEDNTNILTLPAGFISNRKAFGIVKTWLNTKFKGEERHVRRLKQIEKPTA